ncbi:MAG: nucleotidyltransferase family protein [Acetobacter sp.]|nr:nucleotidyltransferase family protein [Bacteroides sp.]MCM1340408.1 nucleotidyltransferase family protein [Acetobacter sp.]MCM1432945.1 nucleotidyltransferase family protein [Clostridiales bacterium]
MKKEEVFLIELCRNFINGGKVVIPKDIEYDMLFRLAEHHNLLGVCHCALNGADGRENVPKEFLKSLENSFFDYIFNFQCQSNALEELRRLFSSAEIKYVLFKGACLRELYSVPEARAMGDIDLLIKTADSEKVRLLLTANGYRCAAENGNVLDYVKNNVLLEVHTKIISEFGENVFDDAFNNAEFDGYTGALYDSYNLAYMIAHTANHLKYTGAGIRFIMDIAVMLKNRNANIEKTFEILDKINLTEFGQVLLSVCCEWFGIGKSYSANTDRVQEYLVEDGVFGSMKDSVRSTVSRLRQCRALEENGKEKSKSPILLKLRLAFPPYETLRKASYINFIDGRPWLLPAAWAYRFFYNVKNNRGHMLQTVKNIDDEKTIALAKEELKFFEEIGLK